MSKGPKSAEKLSIYTSVVLTSVTVYQMITVCMLVDSQLVNEVRCVSWSASGPFLDTEIAEVPTADSRFKLIFDCHSA